jgi:integrase/recombinase XerD
MSTLAPLLQSYFNDRLIGQRQASPNTVASYRDTWCLLLHFAQRRTGKAPHKLAIEDIDAPLVGAFLDHLESERRVSVRTRNARLTAIRSLFHYAAYRHPEQAAVVQRVLAIPSKSTRKTIVRYLNEEEIEALLAAPDRSRSIGRRDHILLLLALETGLRVSELTGLSCSDVRLGVGAHVHCVGKGRKERITPLRPETRAMVEGWLGERAGGPQDPLFPGPRGGRLSRDGVRRLLERHVVTASLACPSLATASISPHVLRHSAAMRWRRHGIDLATIAILLGHEDPRTTHATYLHADLAMKESALALTAPLNTVAGRYRAGDPLLRFLEEL